MDGCQGMLYGPAKRRANQLLMETISIHTLDLSRIKESAYKLHLSMMKAHDFASKVRYQRTRNSLISFHSSSSSFCDELVQLRPMQAEHMALHSIPAFLHENVLPHPVLHPHGRNKHTVNTLPSPGSKERPIHCCTV